MKTRARKAFWLQMLPLIVGFVVLLAIVGTRSWLIEVQRTNQDALMAASRFERLLTEVLSDLKDAETGQRGFLLTGDEAYLEPLRAARTHLPTALGEIRAKASGDSEQTMRLASLEDLVAAKLGEIDEVVGLYRSGRSSEAIEMVRTNEGKRIMDALRSTVDGLRRSTNASVAARLQSSLTASRLLSVASVAALVALGWLAVVSVIGTRRRMIEIVDAHDELAAANASLAREIAQKEEAESQVRQMQKMEAVGQLTGGIAHDFNNMLAVIVSALNLIQRKVARGETDLGQFVDAAMDAAKRAASLTQRLLAFSRQQPLAPQVLDANRLIAGMSEILARTLGATIQIETVLAGGLWKSHSDSSQVENAVLNLAVNARDAMPEGGKLTIETANAYLDDRYASLHAGVPAGQYVMLSVTDTGVGMPPEVVARAFDPFFTTKAVDKGTGLGLSQVFGFVKQSGGHVKIYSEPGQGTSVKIYLPRHFGNDQTHETIAPSQARAAGPDEVILVVEDDPRVRALSVAALTELGYTVLQADGAVAALQQVQSRTDISLLFTDIVMPDINGRKLADRVATIRPALKVLFTTGFTRNAVVHNGVLDHGVNFIAKPFTIDQLAQKVRDVLDSM